LLKEEVDENIQDWFEEDDEIVQEKTKKILNAFVDLKKNGDKCYERLNLFYYENLKNEEIANRLGLKDATTVKNLINRCRNIIKTMLGVK
jgi:DNA-directed RNA polymerase specialized sigma24 family protein